MRLTVRRNDDFSKLADAYLEVVSQCKFCGRKRKIAKNQDKIICDFCGNYIFKDKEAEFKFRLKEKLNKHDQSDKKSL